MLLIGHSTFTGHCVIDHWSFPHSLSPARSIAKQSHHSLRALPIQRPLWLNQMGANLMADRPKNAVGEFDGIVIGIQFTGLLAGADNSQDEFKTAPPFRGID